MENVNEIARITSGFDRRKNGQRTHTHTEYHRTLSSKSPCLPIEKLIFPRWVSSHCDSAGMVQINNLWEFNPKKNAVIYTHIYIYIYIHQWFQWAKISSGLRRRPKSFTFKPLHQNEENVRKPSVLLLEVEMVGIMLESFPDFPFSSKTSKARLGFLFPFFYVRRTQFVLKLIRSGMVRNSKWPAHQCMLAAKNSWSNPALLLRFALFPKISVAISYLFSVEAPNENGSFWPPKLDGLKNAKNVSPWCRPATPAL